MKAVDTNVFVYAHDATDPVKLAKAHELLDRLILNPGETVLLWQVLGEFLACLRRWESIGRLSTADVESHTRDVIAMFPLRTATVATIEISFRLRDRFSLSHWDSMLLAACKEAGVDTLYSEDMDAGTDYDGLKIINPFV